MKNKGGRPEKIPDWKEIDKLCALHCTVAEIEAYVDITHETLDKHCKIAHDISFSKYLALKMGMGKISLRRRQWKLSEKSTAMAIFLGKNMLGQKDKQEVEHSVSEIKIDEQDKDL